jgi:hypothetical protein
VYRFNCIAWTDRQRDEWWPTCEVRRRDRAWRRWFGGPGRFDGPLWRPPGRCLALLLIPGSSRPLPAALTLIFSLVLLVILHHFIISAVHYDIKLDSIQLIYHRVCCTWKEHSVPTPPPSSTRGKAGRNHLNEEITPLLPKWDRRAIQPNLIKFRTCSALAPMWTPPINESAELWGKELSSQFTTNIGLTVEALDTPWYGHQKLHV